MIIEVFGSPGVGKTTFAIALSERLRRRGVDVELAISYRPAELTAPPCAQPQASSRASDIVRRLTRPAKELFTAASNAPVTSQEAAMAATLLQLLPPRSIFWSLRLRQYTRRLSHSWNAIGRPDRCVICDQAFVQLVCSLVLLTASAERERVVRALHVIPRAELLVHLQAPRDMVRARLVERERRQSMFEQLLEFDLATNLRSVDVLDQLDLLLTQQGRSVIRLACTDRQALHQAVAHVEAAVLEQRRKRGLAA